MKYLSLFSGIEAASVAWKPLGWTPVAFAETDPFARAVLAHHYLGVPNLGDISRIGESEIVTLGPIDLVVFGWPCQDLSVAGKRAGLSGERSELFYEATRILRLGAEHAGCRWFVAENVPGLLSSSGGRDFGEVIREATGLTIPVPRDGWGNGGVVARNDGGWSIAWRVLDAQFFGVPQRRRRVFVVGCLGDWRGAAAVLFERHGLSGHPPPGRAARPDVAPGVAGCLDSGGNDGGFRTEPGEHLIAGPLTSGMSKGPRGSEATDSGWLVAHALRGKHNLSHRKDTDNLVAHTLRADGFDASEDGTGRGTPLVPCYPIDMRNAGRDPEKFDEVNRQDCGLGEDGDPTSTLSTVHVPAVAYIVNAAESCARQSHARETETARCLDSTGSFANAQGGTVVACDLRNGAETGDVAQTLQVGGHGASPNNLPHVAAFDPRNVTSAANRTRVEPGLPCPTLHEMPMSIIGHGVRRLTPRECERLMGFEDDWTLVPYRGKSASDGPRYRAIGNSFAVPVIRWIGRRIDMVTELIKGAQP